MGPFLRALGDTQHLTSVPLRSLRLLFCFAQGVGEI